MPDKAYAGRLAGAVLLGLVTLVVAFIAFVFLLPYLLPLALGTALLALILLALWGITYAAAVIGAMIYYFFRPMRVSRKDKGYSIAKAEEAGKRQKGKS
jgi:membrane protein implicated in regulation of membrane protease activity